MPRWRYRLWLASLLALLSAWTAEANAQAQPAGARPNILWITCEDISPNLGCYGDTYAVTPNLDRLAAESVRFTRAFAPIGVCAPSRSTLITGVYACALGTQHMRCQGRLPDFVHPFPQYLREAGYYCTNNSKTDYNFAFDKATWDESSARAHWRKRRNGQPFFSVFNFVTSHESQIRLAEPAYLKRTADFSRTERHDPARAPVPPYHPDAPEVRKDWARYYDMITYMDKQVGNLLAELEADGLAGETIVCFFSDHGAGMPRSKRWLYQSSTRVPFLVRFPAQLQGHAPGKPGETCDRLVSFVDFAPTVLSLAGVPIPGHMQGTAFLGPQAGPARKLVFGFRDRMDERYDMLRSVFDGRYRYIRNDMPALPWFHEQFISYMYEMPTMRVWQQLADLGKLSGPAAVFMAPRKPPEELYDVQADPWEVRNLAGAPQQRETLNRLRQALAAWSEEIVDLGYLPEADLRTRFGAEAPYEAVRRAPARYPLSRIREAAEVASGLDRSQGPRLEGMLRDEDPAVRYWAATGLGALGPEAVGSAAALATALADQAPWVRVAAADALCRMERFDQALPALDAGLKSSNEWVRLQAINTLDRIGKHARPELGAIEAALRDSNEYVVRVAEHALAHLRDRPAAVP